jgi:hypothetical protein
LDPRAMAWPAARMLTSNVVSTIDATMIIPTGSSPLLWTRAGDRVGARVLDAVAVAVGAPSGAGSGTEKLLTPGLQALEYRFGDAHRSLEIGCLAHV